MTCWHPLMSSCSSSPPFNLLHRLPVPRFRLIRRLRRRLPLFSSEFIFPLIILLCCWHPMAAAEKTLCERKLAQVPSNVFYYQRTEAAAGTVECAERCVEDWEFCRSALLVQQKGKSLCQLYGVSFERLLPLTLPQLTPAQADPERLLPITLIELADPPCSSKFSANSQLIDQLSPGAKDALAMMPRPSATKKFQPPQLEQLEDATVLGGPKKGGGNDLEEGLGGFGQEDKTYLTDFPPSKGAADTKPASSAAAGGSSGFAMDTFGPMPIRPSFVSHGIEHPGSGGTWGNRCRNGFCGPRGQTSSATSPNRGLLPCAARKTTDPCAPQPQWLEWTPGSCSVSCGNGTRERRRYCSSGKQTDCAGEDTESERCVMPSCDQWTDWTEWSRCSVSCGGGQRTRERVCRTGDRCTGPASDSRSCNDQFCPQWAEWADWGQCSASCGRGSQRRVRECMPKEAECGGLSTEHRQCELRPCPSWGDWEPWSSCSKTCGGGEAIRRRECQNGVADDCRGPAVEHLLCNTQPCPAWSSWTDWGACSKSCGEGSTKLRQRECRYGGLLSEDCAGPAQDETQCRLAECPAWTEWTLWSRQCRPNGFGCQGGDREVRFCQKAVCPYFDNWTEWGGCSVTCGQGFCERRRNCIRDADLGRNGAATASSADGDDREVPSGGSGGSRTEAKGGRGRNKEKEAEEEEDKEDAEAAENESEPSRSRNGWSASGGAGRSLPEDITAAADSLSAQTLQVAQSAATVAVDRRRSPLISSKLTLLRDNNTGGGDCMGPDVERKPCDAGPCCAWAAWSPWSNCRVRCGNSGNRERTRRCQLEQANNNDCGSTTAAEGGPCNYNQQQSGRFSGNFGGFAPHNPFNGLAGQQCSICIGESRQSETCAIPDPGRLCDEEKSERPRDLRARPKLREEVESAQSHQPMREQQQPPVLDDDDRIKVAGIIDEEQEKEDCYWTEWSEWSVCDPKTLLRNRTRMCAGLRALADNCQCQGPILAQIACPVSMMMPMPMPDNLRTSSSSLIKRVQLIPRHKPSRAEKEREEQRKSGKEPQTTVDQLVKREQPMAPESAAKAEECADWLEWSPWTQCLGPCGREGLRSRTRECQCQRGCAGISRETVSCQTMDC